MTGDQMITVAAAFLSGAIGGIAAIAAYLLGYLNTEKTERRKQKIDLVQELMASRYVLTENYPASDVDVRDFNRAMARIPYVFSDNQPVIAAFDRFFSDKSTDNLLALLEQALASAGLQQYSVARSHLAKTFMVTSGPKLIRPTPPSR